MRTGYGPLVGERLATSGLVGVRLAVAAVVLLSSGVGLPRIGEVFRSRVIGLAAVVGTSMGLAGMLITITAGTGLAGLHFYREAGSLPNGSGGIPGAI